MDININLLYFKAEEKRTCLHRLGSLVRFYVEEVLNGELLLMVWDIALMMIRRHAITILLLHGGDSSLALAPQ